MTPVIALRLGRVSNLPTVWSNALAGVVLAGGVAHAGPFAVLIGSVSLAYVGGMYLNDAFDADIDARERPERPIPSGEVARGVVFGWGYAMLAASIAGLAVAGAGTGLWPAAAGIGLSAMILFYNWHHKANPMGPVVMGMCRLLVYVAAGLTVTTALPMALGIGAALVLCHLIGLTYAAKQENLARIGNLWPLAFLAAPLLYGLALIDDGGGVGAACWIALLLAILFALRRVRRRGPGDMPRAVMTLIAAISLLDALLIAGAGRSDLALLAACGCPLTLFLQHYVRGT